MRWEDDCEVWVGKNLKGSGHGILKGNIPELTLSDRKKTIEVTRDLAENQIGHLLHVGCRCVNLLTRFVFQCIVVQ
jgi:hypothetical protein